MLLPAKRCQEPMTVVGQDEYPLVGWLVGGLEPWNFMTSPIVGMMIQSDEVTHIFQRAR